MPAHSRTGGAFCSPEPDSHPARRLSPDPAANKPETPRVARRSSRRRLPLPFRAALLTSALLAAGCDAETGPKEPPTQPAQAGAAESHDLIPPPPPSKPGYWDDAWDFTANLDLAPNLVGSIGGEIAFLQNTLVGPNRAGKKRPLLVTDRAAYLLFFPQSSDHQTLEAVIAKQDGTTLGLPLNRPERGAYSDFNNMDGRPAVVFSKRAWNAVIPWDFMHPGMSITIRDQSGAEGELPATAFEFGAPLELVTQHIELGMLLDPSEVPVNKWTRTGQNLSPELALDYFQMVPIAQFTAAQYLPIHLPKVVLPNGNVYTERSSYTDAGVYKGDMRENIAKGLVSTGINNANVGVSSSFGGNQGQPRPYRQTTVHTSAGIYTGKNKQGNDIAKKVVHGLSGGGGQLTLQNTTGNEFSHEYGHDHGLGHYPGGPLSTHRRDGSWGFNQFKHRLIGNLNWNGAPADSNLPYSFGKDAMAGGAPMGPISQFTLHTPFSLMTIQEKVTDQSGVLDSESPTGYSRWNAAKQSLVAAEVETPRPDKVGVPVATLVGFYDPEPPHALPSFIYPALYGNWGTVFMPSTITNSDTELAASRCWLEVHGKSGKPLRFPLKDKRIKPKLMNQFHINLPASPTFDRVLLRYRNDDGSLVDLDSRDIAPPHGKLPPPVIVGRESGYSAAALRLRDMEQLLIPGGYPSSERLHQAMEDYYGRILDHASDLRVDIGHVYRHNGAYFQARSDNPGQPPAGDHPLWRKLGEAADFVSDKRLALGEQSVDYAQEVMKGKSGVFYYVPVDHDRVFTSDAYSPKSGKWYGKGSHSKLTVLGVKPDGSRARIVLRGQVNDRHILNFGAPVDASSRVRFRFHKEDNPELPAGTYQIQFAAYAQAWHTRKLVESFEVRGEVEVK
jgi:hypothetical protein